MEYLKETVESDKDNYMILAIMFIDLNRFKQINDTLGHEVGDIPDTNPAEQTVVSKESTKNGDITVWAANGGLEGISMDFEIYYPNIKVNITKFDSLEKFNSECLSALSSGTGPDVFFFDSSFFGQYTVNGVLEDLLQEPYSAGRYEEYFPPDLWESNKSVDGRSLLAMTFLTSPRIIVFVRVLFKNFQFNPLPVQLKLTGNYLQRQLQRLLQRLPQSKP